MQFPENLFMRFDIIIHLYFFIEGKYIGNSTIETA